MGSLRRSSISTAAACSGASSNSLSLPNWRRMR
jgi:hypothetical protein